MKLTIPKQTSSSADSEDSKLTSSLASSLSTSNIEHSALSLTVFAEQVSPEECSMSRSIFAKMLSMLLSPVRLRLLGVHWDSSHVSSEGGVSALMC